MKKSLSLVETERLHKLQKTLQKRFFKENARYTYQRKISEREQKILGRKRPLLYMSIHLSSEKVLSISRFQLCTLLDWELNLYDKYVQKMYNDTNDCY
jgi:hypothetical protein